MSTPAGWYPDPSAPPAGHSSTPRPLRWWDGQAWTENVHVPESPVGLSFDKPGERHRGGQSSWSSASAQQSTSREQVPWTPGEWPGVNARQSHTPDGQPLGNLGLRLLARVIDFFIYWSIAFAAAQGPIALLTQRMQGFSDELNRAAAAGPGAEIPPLPGFAELNQDGVLVQLLLVLGVLSLLYSVLFVRFLGATPGKLVCRLRVRAWERGGLPTWKQAILRWLTREVVANLSVIGLIFWLLDSLWPLWDKRRQGLHDKLGKTVVVRR